MGSTLISLMQTILTLIAAVIPFQFALNPAAGFDVAVVRLLILAAAALWCMHALRDGGARLPIGWTGGFLAIFLVLTLLSAASARDTGWFLRKEVFLFNFAALFLVAASLPTIDIRRILRVAAGSGAIAAIVVLAHGVAQFAVGPDAVAAFWARSVAPVAVGRSAADAIATYSSAYAAIGGTDYLRASGLFPDPHVAAFFLTLTLPLTIAMAVTAHGGRRALWSIGAVATAIAIAATLTRGAYVALAAGALITLCLAAADVARRGRWKPLLWSVVVLACAAYAVAASPLGQRAASVVGDYDTSIGERLAIWRDAANIISAHPFSGVGIGNYPLTVAPTAIYRDPYYAHSLYLDIAVEAGIPAAAAFTVLLLIAAWRLAIRHGGPDGTAGAVAILMLCVHGMFDTPLWSVHVLPLLMLLLAAAAAPVARRHIPHPIL